MSHTDQMLSSESSIAANQRTALSEILWLEEAVQNLAQLGAVERA